jgi:dihydrofolate reductase
MINNKSKVSVIVAMDEKNGIGKGNALMWNIPEELKRFREITIGHPIIMGRKTHESIGRVLPGRTNIVITRDKDFKAEGCVIVYSLEEAIEKARNVIASEARQSLKKDSGLARMTDSEEIFIIGGGQIFEQAFPLADKLYVTVVQGDFKADTFFPDYSDFKKVVFEKSQESSGHKYKFLELDK